MRFRANPNFRQQIEREPAFRQGLLTVAKAAAEESNAIGHRIMPKDSGPVFTAEVDADGVKIVNHSSGWHIAEYGSVNSPVYAPWRLGLRAAGLRSTGL